MKQCKKTSKKKSRKEFGKSKFKTLAVKFVGAEMPPKREDN